jgi:hypothetical protein
MNPRPSSTKTRRECFDQNRRVDETGRIYMECHICHGRIWPGSEKWEAEHPTPHANGGKDVLPAHSGCHKEKTKKDVSSMAHGKNASDRHFGIERSKGFGWSKRFKKKISGEVVER